MHSEKLTPFEHFCLRVRNILVIIAALLFILSLIPAEPLHSLHHRLVSTGYFVGAGAYLAEWAELFDYEKRHNFHHRRRLFMPNVFVLLYIIMGLAHLMD